MPSCIEPKRNVSDVTTLLEGFHVETFNTNIALSVVRESVLVETHRKTGDNGNLVGYLSSEEGGR
jgi:hypothetical protein